MKVNFEKKKEKYAWDLKSRRLRDKIPWGVTWNIRSKMVYQSLTKKQLEIDFSPCNSSLFFLPTSNPFT